jgi:hypothetical protein
LRYTGKNPCRKYLIFLRIFLHRRINLDAPVLSCQNCLCFIEEQGPRVAGEPRIGECWLRPPVVIVTGDGEPACLRPLVSTEEFCLEGFTPKEIDTDEESGENLDDS